jgi:hypothetical protein
VDTLSVRFARATIVLAIGMIASCGGGGPAGPVPPVTEVRTFTGTTRATGASSCTGDHHDFQAREGPITVTSVESSGGASLVAQVCAGGIDDNNCTINQTPIAVGQTLSGTRRGGASQGLVLQPLNCGGGGPPPATPIDYTATVSYLR